MKSFTSQIFNQLRCWGSYALSMIDVQRVRHLPTFVSIEPANFCQLSCPECPVGMRRTKTEQSADQNELSLGFTQHQPAMLSLDNYRHIIAQVAPYAHTLQLFWQGEPLLNRDLPEMIRIAREAGLYTIVSTNAQALDQPMAEALVRAGLNRIIVSMDGWTQQTYEQYRQGGSVLKVKDAVRRLRQAKSQTHSRMTIELQCLRLRTNESEWGIFRREYRKLGADRLTMKTAQLYDYAQGSPLMPSNTRYARYKYDEERGEYVLKHRLRNRCLRLWSGCVVDISGNVFPCCYDKNHQYLWGNLLRQPLADIFHGEQARRFRASVLAHRASVPICTNCDE